MSNEDVSGPCVEGECERLDSTQHSWIEFKVSLLVAKCSSRTDCWMEGIVLMLRCRTLHLLHGLAELLFGGCAKVESQGVLDEQTKGDAF